MFLDLLQHLNITQHKICIVKRKQQLKTNKSIPLIPGWNSLWPPSYIHRPSATSRKALCKEETRKENEALSFPLTSSVKLPWDEEKSLRIHSIIRFSIRTIRSRMVVFFCARSQGAGFTQPFVQTYELNGIYHEVFGFNEIYSVVR